MLLVQNEIFITGIFIITTTHVGLPE